MIIEVKLNTLHMFENEDKEDADYPLWKKITAYMDGEQALVMKSSLGDGNYVFLGLKDKEKDKELHYMMEQDGMMGTYLDDREEFDKDWESGEYSPDGTFYIEPKYLIFENKEDNHAERID